jgi:hypothetical protein
MTGAVVKRGEALSHILFCGPPGLGKITLAVILGREMNSNVRVTSGPVIEKTADLAGLLTGLERADILFIDEIHVPATRSGGIPVFSDGRFPDRHNDRPRPQCPQREFIHSAVYARWRNDGHPDAKCATQKPIHAAIPTGLLFHRRFVSHSKKKRTFAGH